MELIIDKLHSFSVQIKCDKCKDGVYMHVNTGIDTRTEQNVYEHECSECGRLKYFNSILPIRLMSVDKKLSDELVTRIKDTIVSSCIDSNFACIN